MLFTALIATPQWRRTRQAGLEPWWGPDRTSGKWAESLCRTVTNLPQSLTSTSNRLRNRILTSWSLQAPPAAAAKASVYHSLNTSALDGRSYRDANRLTFCEMQTNHQDSWSLMIDPLVAVLKSSSAFLQPQSTATMGGLAAHPKGAECRNLTGPYVMKTDERFVQSSSVMIQIIHRWFHF